MTSGHHAYRAPRWLPGSHAQTIFPSLARRPHVAYRREKVESPDGDFLHFDWVDGPHASPVVVLFHGLEGNSSSAYARSLMRHLRSIGWRGVVPHFRGCSGEPNRLPRAYHSGDYTEVEWILRNIRARAPDSKLFAVGVSLGGSALLNYLGRPGLKASAVVSAAAAISAPLDLTAAGVSIGEGLNKIYTWHFLKTLKPKALAMAMRFPDLLDANTIRRAYSMYAFDDAVTAPLHGFASAADYWRRASSVPWLKSISVPTLVINAENDPFIPFASLPGPREVSPAVVLERPAHGGHCGFAGSRLTGNSAWLPQRLVAFFDPEPGSRP